MKRSSILAPVLGLALLAGCGSAGNPETALEAVRATEQAQLQAFAAKDLRGAVRNYRDDAVVVAPGIAPASGGEAIAGVFDDLLSDPHFKLETTPGPSWAAEKGDLAVTTSTGRLTTTDDVSGQPATVDISNQTVWIKETGAPWRIVSEYNVELPAPAAANTAAE